MKKILILFVFLLTGCTAEYTININKDFSFTEQIELLMSNRIAADGYSNVYEGLMARVNNYYYVEDFKSYKYSLIQGKENSGYNFTKYYSNISKIDESMAFENLFKDAIFEETKEKLVITFVFDKEDNIFTEAIDYDSSFKSIDVKISIPYLIIEGNYDDIDGEGIMTWKYNPSSDKNLYFTIDKTKLKTGEKIESKNYDKFIIYGIIALFMAVIIGFISYIFINKSNYNKF